MDIERRIGRWMWLEGRERKWELRKKVGSDV